MPKIEGYIGICGACFEPIAIGDEMQFRKNGKYFHQVCAKTKPNSYYLALERIRGQFEQGADFTNLLDEMSRLFKIPALNDPTYNEDHQEVIQLYREITHART